MRSPRRALRLAVLAFSLSATVMFSGVTTASADTVWNGAHGTMAMLAR